MKKIIVFTGFIFAIIFVLTVDCLAQKNTVLVAYHSVNGHTVTMAKSIQKGILESSDIKVILKPVNEVTRQDLLDAKAIVIGSPVYNANPSPDILSFIKTWPFEGQPLKNKLGAVFVTAGGLSSGEELVQSSLLHAMLVYGMIVMGGDDWKSSFGASGIHEEGKYQSKEIDNYFLDKGFRLGKRMAEVLTMMK
ncbi:MAG: flavodoxin family protein [Bacteroidota bacterium]